MIELFRDLISCPEQIKTELTVVFDWYDGPRGGVCRFVVPRVEAQFELLSERPTADGLDERLYALRGLPDGTIGKILTALACFGRPSTSVWIPHWDRSNPAASAAERQVDELLAGAAIPEIVVLSSDMASFYGCWHVPCLSSETRDCSRSTDWWTHLGL